MNTNKNETTTPSQADRILEHLKSGMTLTPLEALRQFDCFRLAARIHDLRKLGHDIKAEDWTPSYKGQGSKTVTRYFL